MAIPPRLASDAAGFEEAALLRLDLVEEGPRLCIVIHDVPLPPGTYAVEATELLFLTDGQYPYSALDMFWTDLEVLRPDRSVPRNAEVIESYLGRQWRRFSWHRSGPHNPGRNLLLDHYEFVSVRFEEDRSE